MSLSEKEDPDDEFYADADGLPFVVTQEVISGFGETYAVSLTDDRRPLVTTPPRHGSTISCALASRASKSSC